jgi:GNAT superfamily N-acetyltransferase
MIRAAQFADVPRLAQLLEEAHGASIYAERAQFDEREAKALFVRAIQRHAHKTVGGSLVLVAERDGTVEAFIVGHLERVYYVLDRMTATDLFFICSPRAHAHDARTLLDGLVQWAEGNPKVIEIRLGVTNAIGNWQRTGRFYERLGFEKAGAMYERRLP